jgi:hypothetical protein
MSGPISDWRQVYLYDLPLTAHTALLLPESAILRFPNDTTIDVGALCYLKREKPSFRANTAPRDKGRKVVLESLDRGRVERVRALIEHISAEVAAGGRRVETIRTGVGRLMTFMGWADDQGRHDVLNSGAAAFDALKLYVAFVQDRVSRNEITLNSGARQQAVVIALLGNFLDIDDFGRGLFLLRVDPSTKTGTSPPCELAQGKILSLSSCLFESLFSLTVNFLPYPHSMPMPEYLSFPQNQLWAFPGTSWFKSPSMIENGCKWNPGNNYIEGRVATVEEIMQVSKVKGAAAVVRTARRTLRKANADSQHTSRRQAAMTAMLVYQIMFVANTAMSWAQFTTLTWSPNFEVESAHQGFRKIKWRAGGKLVSFELPVAALVTFRRFIEVRKYLLRGGEYKYLFFSMDSTKVDSIRQITGRLDNIYKTLKRIDPSLPKVLPRQWRAAKSDWLIKNTDISTTALVLQNTERTVIASYAEGSETQQVEEFSNLFDQMSQAVLSQEVVLPSATQRSLGKCISFGKPKIMPGMNSIAPNCNGIEGCLACDKLKLHADEQDTRKLLSCRHCLRRSAALLDNHEHERTVLKPLLDRIEEILLQLKKIDHAMVERLIVEVDDEGELDPYWAGKLAMLMELGIIQ